MNKALNTYLNEAVRLHSNDHSSMIILGYLNPYKFYAFLRSGRLIADKASRLDEMFEEYLDRLQYFQPIEVFSDMVYEMTLLNESEKWVHGATNLFWALGEYVQENLECKVFGKYFPQEPMVTVTIEDVRNEYFAEHGAEPDGLLTDELSEETEEVILHANPNKVQGRF